MRSVILKFCGGVQIVFEAVLKPIWVAKAETASRVRGRIEKVLDAAKAKGFRDGENPARWRGHLDHLLPRPSRLSRSHHAAMPYEEVAAFVGKLREREATSALALELCILNAASPRRRLHTSSAIRPNRPTDVVTR